jgi:hypothetical protein
VFWRWIFQYQMLSKEFILEFKSRADFYKHQKISKKTLEILSKG